MGAESAGEAELGNNSGAGSSWRIDTTIPLKTTRAVSKKPAGRAVNTTPARRRIDAMDLQLVLGFVGTLAFLLLLGYLWNWTLNRPADGRALAVDFHGPIGRRTLWEWLGAWWPW